MKLTPKQKYAIMHKNCPSCKYWKEEVDRRKEELKQARWELKHHRVR